MARSRNYLPAIHIGLILTGPDSGLVREWIDIRTDLPRRGRGAHEGKSQHEAEDRAIQ